MHVPKLRDSMVILSHTPSCNFLQFSQVRIRHLPGSIYISIKKLLSCQHLIQRGEFNTTSEAKHTKVLDNEEVLKTDNKKNVIDNAKEDDSENSQKKIKDISNTNKETYE